MQVWRTGKTQGVITNPAGDTVKLIPLPPETTAVIVTIPKLQVQRFEKTAAGYVKALVNSKCINGPTPEKPKLEAKIAKPVILILEAAPAEPTVKAIRTDLPEDIANVIETDADRDQAIEDDAKKSGVKRAQSLTLTFRVDGKEVTYRGQYELVRYQEEGKPASFRAYLDLTGPGTTNLPTRLHGYMFFPKGNPDGQGVSLSSLPLYERNDGLDLQFPVSVTEVDFDADAGDNVKKPKAD